jgi:hypothetical protein
MILAAKTDKDGRWCAEPVFDATIRNVSLAPVWLEMGRTDDELVLTSSFVDHWTKRRGSSQGSVIGRSDDWGSIDDLRAPDATMLKAGGSVVRSIRLEDVRLTAGRVTVNVRVRIHGTQDLGDGSVRTYEPAAEQELVLRRKGRCFEVQRLTSR